MKNNKYFTKKDLWWILFLTIYFVSFSIFLFYFQPRYSGGIDDFFYYEKIVKDIIAHNPISTGSPFVYRIGTPLLVYFLSENFNIDIYRSFFIVNSFLLYIIYIIIFYFASRKINRVLAFLIILLYSLPYFSYHHYLFYYPQFVDLGFVICLLLLAFIIDNTEYKFKNIKYELSFVTIVSAISVLFREVGLGLPLVWMLYKIIKDNNLIKIKKALIYCIPFFISSLVFILIKLSVIDDHSFRRYTFFEASMSSIITNLKNSRSFIIAILLAFGGSLMSLILFINNKKFFLNIFHENIIKILLICFYTFLSFIGGVNTIRFLSWISPIFLFILFYWAWSMRDKVNEKNKWNLLLMINLIGYLYSLHILPPFYSTWESWTKYGGLQSKIPLRNLLPFILLFLFNYFYISYFKIKCLYTPK